MREPLLKIIDISEIEGEMLDREQVRSSIARRLGMDIGGLVAADRHVEGVVEMTLDATRKYDQPLTGQRLFAWHPALPTRRSGMSRIMVGAWRAAASNPMLVVSGPIGCKRIHYDALAAERLDAEMARFLDWCETATPDPVVKAPIAPSMSRKRSSPR